MSKLQRLAEIEGYSDTMDLLQEATFDSVAAGICRVKGCEYTTQVEPDCNDGWCEECQRNTVASCLVLAGMI